MAEFGIEATTISPVQNAIEPLPGVGNSAAVVDAASSILGTVNDLFESRQSKRNDAFVVDFMEQQLNVVDALDQGTGGIRSAAQARTILRKNFLQAVNANPSLREKLVEAQTEAVSMFGGNEIVSDGNLEEQRYNDRTDSLVSNGLLAARHTDAEREAADVSERLAIASKNRFDEQTRTINMQLAQDNLTETQRTRLEAQKSQAALRLIQDTSGTELTIMRNQFDAILSAEGTEAEKQQAIEDAFIDWNARANNLIGQVQTGEFSAFLTPFESLRDTYISRATGEYSDNELNRRTERILAINENLALQDPEIARIATASELFSDSIFQRALLNNTDQFNAAMRWLAGGAPSNPEDGPNGVSAPAPTPFTTDDAGKAAMTEYLGAVFRGLESPNPEVRSEAEGRVLSLLDSVEDYEGMIRRNPEAGIALVSWMAGPEFQNAQRSNPELFANIGPMAEVLKNHYEDEVWSMVSREFRNNSVEVVTGEVRNVPSMSFGIMGGGSTGATDQRNVVGSENVTNLVGARSTASGMEFFPLVTEGDASIEARAQARKLNNELAPVINTTIKAASHLSGHTNYQKMWEDRANDILGGGMTTDSGDDLEMGDFSSGGAEAQEVVDAGPGYTVIRNSDGSTTRRVGTRAWRNNNPGNIEAGRFATSQGAVGTDGRFAVFPTYEAGRAAKSALLFESPSYRNRTIRGAISRYAPTSENDTEAYIAQVAQAAGVPDTTVMNRLTPEQRVAMLDAMERVEGFREGSEEPVMDVSGSQEYNSEEQAQRALERGEISIGDTVVIAGQVVRVDG